MNRCLHGGWLVDGTRPLPTDPIDHDVTGLPVHGCSRLRCTACGAEVRSQAGLTFRAWDQKVDVGPLYQTSDLASSPLLVERAGSRLYLCRCRRHGQGGPPVALDEPGTDAFNSPNLPWECAGHPLAELPREIDGVQVSAGNLGDLVARSLGGWTPPAAHPEDAARAFWAARLHARLTGTPHAAEVERAAAARLDDADAATRARALQFFFTRPLRSGQERTLALMQAQRPLFAGVPDRITPVKGDATLEDTAWRVLTPLVAAGSARDLARADALAAGKGSAALYAALASGDAEWVAGHAEEIARATPARHDDLVKMIRYRFPKNVPSKPVLDRLKR